MKMGSKAKQLSWVVLIQYRWQYDFNIYKGLLSRQGKFV